MFVESSLSASPSNDYQMILYPSRLALVEIELMSRSVQSTEDDLWPRDYPLSLVGRVRTKTKCAEHHQEIRDEYHG